jgi:hypothetical protein
MAREIKKRVKNAILYTDGTIRISGVRFSYPHLKKPYKGDDDKGEAKFGVVGLMPKKTHRAAKDLIKERIDELLAENKVKALAADKKFLRDGDQSGKDGYEGMYTVSARESRRPPLRNRDNSVVEPEDAAEVFQPGFWGDILIRPWYQNNKFGKRVNAGLSSVQFVKKDEVFGEGRISDDDLDDTFENYGDPDDDDAVDDEDEDEAPRRGKSKSRKSKSQDYDDDDDDSDADEDEDEDEDERPARNTKTKPKPKAKPKRRSRDDDDDDDDDDI